MKYSAPFLPKVKEQDEDNYLISNGKFKLNDSGFKNKSPLLTKTSLEQFAPLKKTEVKIKVDEKSTMSR